MRFKSSLYPTFKPFVYYAILMLGVLFMGSINSVKAPKGKLLLTPLDDFSFVKVSLAEGFSLDPQNLCMVSGEAVNVANPGLCSGCTLSASTAPDVILDWTERVQDLRILFVADDSS